MVQQKLVSSEKTEKNENVSHDEPELRFDEFKGSWREYKLGAVIKEFINGQTPSRNHAEYWDGNIPWVSSGELNYNIIKDTIEKITPLGKESANLKLLPIGTFLIAITGLEASGTRGSCGVLGIEATTNQSCMALIPKEHILDSKFLEQWYLKVGEHYGIKYSQGTKQQSYNMDLLKQLPIKIPDNITEQRKIVNFLSALDKKIELLEKKKEVYNKTKFRILKMIYDNVLINSEDMPINNLFSVKKGKGLSKEKIDTYGRYAAIL